MAKADTMITIVTALALGLRRLRAEVRRRVDAWKILASSGSALAHPPMAPLIDRDALCIRSVSLASGRRISFHSAFTKCASTNGL